ncbi:TonB-dependent receptor [Alteromonas sp. NFXS44]|uniref:TonB-dependent receptor plug domain-containing protein n=1 Tax=Alteromonas sp. NFXS44 TaxID=2818435 RepID=UPI0032DFBA16
MNINPKIAQSIKIAFAMGAASTLLTTTHAFAQDTTTAEQQVEKVQVTGSRIKRTDMETASPVAIISAEDISLGSYTSVEQVLQQSPAASGMATGAASNNGGVGAARINLRGLGANRTLVLVNGRRMVNSGTGADSSVDLNTIPLAAIKRIEVLKDGASAVYGSDAVAGVVNIITKDDFEGFQIDVGYAGSDEGDANTGNISIVTGAGGDKGNIVLGISYVDRGSAMQGDRGFSACPDNDYDAEGNCQSGSSYVPGGAYNAGDGWGTLDSDKDFSEGYTPYNYSERSYLYTPQERIGLFANGNYNLTDDAQAYMEFLYTKRTSTQQMAPSPISATLTADATGNPFGVATSMRRRMTEVGDRVFDQTTDTIRSVVGFQGYLDIGNGFDWDVSYTYGRNDATDRSSNYINLTKIYQTMDTDVCDDVTIPCQDWFATEGNITQETLDYITYTDQASGGNQFTSWNVNLSGELFELPAGFVGFAGGAEYRKEKGWYQPDAVTVAGDGSASAQDPTSGGYDTTQVYAEFAVPLLADVPGAEELSLDAAIRWFDYSTFDSDITWKLGLTWRVNEDLMFRGVASTAFRAPTVDELYGGNVGSFDYLVDPCSGYGSLDTASNVYQACNAQIGNTSYAYTDSQIENTYVTIDNLSPEEADTYTLGVVYSPSFVEGLSMTLDYFTIELSNAISRIDTQSYLDSCYGGDEEACSVLSIVRDDITGNIDYMESPLTNVGTLKTRGVDANVTYNFDALGLNWNVNWDTTRLLEYTEDNVEYTGKIDGNNGGFAEWKSNFAIKAGTDDWKLRWKMRYIGGMTDDYYLESYGLMTDVGTVVYHDVSGEYYINDQWSVSAGIDNLFDKTPPYLYSYNDMNTVPEVYDVLGRYLHARITARF